MRFFWIWKCIRVFKCLTSSPQKHFKKLWTATSSLFSLGTLHGTASFIISRFKTCGVQNAEVFFRSYPGSDEFWWGMSLCTLILARVWNLRVKLPKRSAAFSKLFSRNTQVFDLLRKTNWNFQVFVLPAEQNRKCFKFNCIFFKINDRLNAKIIL